MIVEDFLMVIFFSVDALYSEYADDDSDYADYDIPISIIAWTITNHQSSFSLNPLPDLHICALITATCWPSKFSQWYILADIEIAIIGVSITSVHVKTVFVTARMRNESYGKVKWHPKTIKNILHQDDSKTLNQIKSPNF